jgi:hypothetical protein
MSALGVYDILRHRGRPTVAFAQTQSTAVEGVAPAGEEVAQPAATTVGPSLFDFIGVVAAVLVVGAAAWLATRWARRAPTRGLRAAVRKAKRLNERLEGVPHPHPAPEMETRRRVEEGGIDEPPHRVGAPLAVRRTSPSRGPIDARAQEAMGRLARILSDPDDKDMIADYVRLDTLVRRWLFDRYGVPAFSVSAATLLNSLPQELTDGVVDDAGEVLRVCEVAQLSAHRPSRRELRHPCGLAYELISGDDAASESRADTGRETE